MSIYGFKRNVIEKEFIKFRLSYVTAGGRGVSPPLTLSRHDLGANTNFPLFRLKVQPRDRDRTLEPSDIDKRIYKDYQVWSLHGLFIIYEHSLVALRIVFNR